MRFLIMPRVNAAPVSQNKTKYNLQQSPREPLRCNAQKYRRVCSAHQPQQRKFCLVLVERVIEVNG